MRVSLRIRGTTKDNENEAMKRSAVTFDGDAFTGPLLLEGGEAFPLADADDVLFEVKLFGVKAQEAQPKLSHRLCVLLLL